jgi:hypothetical protein
MTDMPPSATNNVSIVDRLQKPIPEILWHYTSYEAFRNIIESRSIWATDYRFLNDSEEVIHSRNLAYELIEELPETVGRGYPARRFMQQLVDGLFRLGPLRKEEAMVLVSSFSENGDQLSQWRGYANNACGVSIGLDFSKLRTTSGALISSRLAPCIYKAADKRSALSGIFDAFLDEFQRPFNEAVSGLEGRIFPLPGLHIETIQQWVEAKETAEAQIGSIVSDALQQELAAAYSASDAHLIACGKQLTVDLLQVGPLLKNESFEEEREWRLIVQILPNQGEFEHDVQFKASRNGIVPYIAQPLTNSNDESVPLGALILGPGSHPESEFGTNLFLRKKRITIVANKSKIPYRPA